MTYVGAWNSMRPVPFHRLRKLQLGQSIQEGVVNAGDFKVSQRAAGASMSVDIASGHAWVQTDADTPDGLAYVFSDTIDNQGVTASHATLPRVDSVVLQWNESDLPAGAGDDPACRVVAGTPTTGAQAASPAAANYRAGAPGGAGGPAFPNDALLLADILVSALSTSVTTANIVDRRKWARGAYARLNRAATDLTTASATMTAMDTTNLRARMECSGVPMRITLQGIALHTVAATNLLFGAQFDGVDQENKIQQAAVGANINNNVAGTIITVPAAGSHVIDAAFATAAATMTVRATAANPFYMTIEEIVRPTATNT